MTAAFIDAFSHYLSTGDDRHLAQYIAGDYSPALLTVYRNGFYKACIDALSANFPITAQVLSSDVFTSMARQYVDQSPPSKGTLVGYGEGLIDFINSLTNDHHLALPPVTRDLAALDWAWLECLSSEERSDVLTAERVLAYQAQEFDISHLLVGLNPSAAVCKLQLPLFDFWQQVKQGRAIPKTLALTDQVQDVLFWRLSGQVQAHVLTKDELHFFSLITNKKQPLGEVMESTLLAFADFPVQAHFAAALHNGWLVFETS